VCAGTVSRWYGIAPLEEVQIARWKLVARAAAPRVAHPLAFGISKGAVFDS